jgi:hypothetical protein
MMTIWNTIKGCKLLLKLWNNPWFQKTMVRNWWSMRYRNEYVRFSISALVRIRVDDRYLLVKNRKWDKFQPVGGVLKYHIEAGIVMNNCGMRPDSMFKPDEVNDRDLRVQIPGEKIPDFLAWFDQRMGREESPNREFVEELFSTGVLNPNEFGVPNFSFIRQHVNGIHTCEHLSGQPECKIAEIFELIPSPKQKELLRSLMKEESSEYCWADDSLIENFGVKPKDQDAATITDTSKWIL